jgi:ABC-type Mn2+/Zn2+ transport system ATPase subunit
LTLAIDAIRQVREVQAERQQPLAIILAGHNGSGKSTFWRATLPTNCGCHSSMPIA